jgi:hypothetical protein
MTPRTPALLLLLAACSSTSASGPADGGAAIDAPAGGTQCTAARDQLLAPVARTSTGEVVVVSESGGSRIVYVDASAGGFEGARRNPRVYITLDGTKVDVSDRDAPQSTAWDLALKRQVVFTNSGDAGVGRGGGARLAKALDAVTAADAAKITPESFFDAECNARTDEIQDPQTSFSGWYDYDATTMRARPRDGLSFVVRSASGADRYAVAIRSYTGRPDGSEGAPSTGYYLLEIRKL